MAEEALDKAFQVMGEKLIPCQTQDIPLFQKTVHPKPDFISDKIWSHLERTYPNDLNLIAKMVQEHPALAKPLHPSFPHIQAELEFGKRYEWVKTLDDWLYRRSYLGLLGVKKEELCLSALQSS
jgi:glycerol-3-phosphate dehydrogenase